MPGSTVEEAKRAFAHVFRIAEAAGFSAADIVYVDLAFIDLSDVTGANRLYAELFPEGQRPARTIYQAKLPLEVALKCSQLRRDESPPTPRRAARPRQVRRSPARAVGTRAGFWPSTDTASAMETPKTGGAREGQVDLTERAVGAFKPGNVPHRHAASFFCS
jgi:enamine deaminase RidA (YjgF/YER057c/UK114 family)